MVEYGHILERKHQSATKRVNIKEENITVFKEDELHSNMKFLRLNMINTIKNIFDPYKLDKFEDPSKSLPH